MNKDISSKIKTAADAFKSIRSGHRILIGSGAAEPQHLVHELAAQAPRLADAEIISILTLGTAAYASPAFQTSFRHNALFIGSNIRDAVKKGLADYTPCFLHEIPSLFRRGKLALDVAIIQVSPPENGFCSLGVAVDIIKAAVETAPYVVAQINPQMPWTYGDSCVHVDDINAFVECEEPVLELEQKEPDETARWIGRYAAQLIDDGATLQLGIGSIPNAVLAALTEKNDLGVHSEMISDGVLPLIESGIINGRKKTLHPRKVVTSFCMGTRKLYHAINRNPVFEFYPSDYVNDPHVIAKNDKMISINSALQIDLTGQVAADSIGTRFYSGVGGQVDFIRGAAKSSGGRSILALPSTAKGGSISRISPMLNQGTGVVTTRADIDFVVTEFGIASLKGKTIRERAVALIQVAHPDHREALTDTAKELGYIEKGHILPLKPERYRVELETEVSFGETTVFFRPVKPTDEKRLKDLFYSQSDRTRYLRFGAHLSRLSEAEFQQLVSIDYDRFMAIAGFVEEDSRTRMIAVGRYYREPGRLIAEAAFTVHDDYQCRGIGGFLVDYLTYIAINEGLIGFTAEILPENRRMKNLFRRKFDKIDEHDKRAVVMLFEHWKGSGNPAG